MDVFIEFTKPVERILPVYSWLIRMIEGTEYSHVRIRWQNSIGINLIYEASGSSVKLIGDYATNKHPVEVVHSYKFSLNKEEYRKLISLFRFAGVDYGIKQVFGIALARLFKLKKNPLSQGRRSQVCSELVAMFLVEVLGIIYLPHIINLDLVGPKQIQQLLEKMDSQGAL